MLSPLANGQLRPKTGLLLSQPDDQVFVLRIVFQNILDEVINCTWLVETSHPLMKVAMHFAGYSNQVGKICCNLWIVRFRVEMVNR